MVGCRVVNGIVQGEVIEHGLLAFADLLEVGIHRPVSCIGAGSAASFRADVKVAVWGD